MLLARQLPAVGGDTMFASQYKAYEDLSDAMKAFLDPLDVEHDGRIIDPTLTNKSVTHPLVITHPETGRKAIFVNLNYAQRVVQLEAHESRALLDFLFVHCSRNRYQARFRYEPGTLVIWDQRCLLHAGRRRFHQRGARVASHCGVVRRAALALSRKISTGNLRRRTARSADQGAG